MCMYLKLYSLNKCMSLDVEGKKGKKWLKEKEDEDQKVRNETKFPMLGSENFTK